MKDYITSKQRLKDNTKYKLLDGVLYVTSIMGFTLYFVHLFKTLGGL